MPNTTIPQQVKCLRVSCDQSDKVSCRKLEIEKRRYLSISDILYTHMPMHMRNDACRSEKTGALRPLICAPLIQNQDPDQVSSEKQERPRVGRRCKGPASLNGKPTDASFFLGTRQYRPEAGFVPNSSRTPVKSLNWVVF